MTYLQPTIFHRIKFQNSVDCRENRQNVHWPSIGKKKWLHKETKKQRNPSKIKKKMKGKSEDQ